MRKTPRSVYDADEYYAENESGSRLSPAFDWLLRIFDRARVRAVLKTTGLSAGRVLDVGAGDGKFLYFMQREGFEGHGTTTSKRSARAAQALFGLRLDVSASLDNQLREGPFDLVTYWHVFEHLEELPAHRALWPKLIRTGGFLIIEAPNIRSIGARLCYRSWLGSDEKHHINQQAPTAIIASLRALGFEPVRTEYFSGKFSYVYLWSAMLGLLIRPSVRVRRHHEHSKNTLPNAARAPLVDHQCAGGPGVPCAGDRRTHVAWLGDWARGSAAGVREEAAHMNKAKAEGK